MRLPPTLAKASPLESSTQSQLVFISSLMENILSGSLIEDKTGSQIKGICKSYCGLEHFAFLNKRTGTPGFSGSCG